MSDTESQSKRVQLTEECVRNLEPNGEWVSVADGGKLGVVGLQVRMSPQGSKVYQVRCRTDEGRRLTIGLGPVSGLTVKQARDLARQKIADARRGIDPVEQKRRQRADSLTLGKFIEGEYKDTVLAHRKSGQQDLARLKKCFAELWQRRLSDPTLGNAVRNWRSNRLKDGKTPSKTELKAGAPRKGVKASTVNKDIAVLRAVLSHAVDRGLIKEHPLQKLKPIKQDKSPKARYLDEQEERRLLEALDARENRRREERDNANRLRRESGHAELDSLQDLAFTDHLKPMVLLSLHTGMRRGEVFSLDWSDISLRQDEGMVTVRGEKAKGGCTRHIPLNSVATSALLAWKEQTGGRGLVFTSRDGAKFDNVNSSWEALLKAAKIENFRWHDMRHHFASKLVMAGVDLNTVRELLGHSDTKMTLRYAHLAPHVKARAVELLVAPSLPVTPFNSAKKKTVNPG